MRILATVFAMVGIAVLLLITIVWCSDKSAVYAHPTDVFLLMGFSVCWFIASITVRLVED